jgi:hypothetical protein
MTASIVICLQPGRDRSRIRGYYHDGAYSACTTITVLVSGQETGGSFADLHVIKHRQLDASQSAMQILPPVCRLDSRTNTGSSQF